MTASRTLIGRLLYDSKLIFDDQLAALEADSKTVGTQGGELDFALLVDGLAAEREQGITIDVAYRFFATEQAQIHRRRHARATSSTPATWSPAPRPPTCAVILIDARKGVLTQTRRHSYLVSLLGIRHVVLAVNKMDLVGYSAGDLRRDRARLPGVRRARSGSSDITAIPMSALRGDNVTQRSRRHALVQRADAAASIWRPSRSTTTALQAQPFRMPVQWVNRPNLDFRGFAGMIAGGAVQPGRRGPRPAVGTRRAGSRASSPTTAISPRRSPASRSR